PEPTPEATPEPTPEPTATPSGGGGGGGASGGNPAALQVQAFNLNNQGRYAEALPVAQRAVELCQGSTQVSPCAYALYEYARALRLTGDPQQAVAVLEERLQRFPDDQRATVEAELRRARRAAAGS
ncbi:MAG TPA: tetratricopeptide repeat protein, partial [Solirubrobacteraceae bacterium]|nr:tetratricopeptide repeat protein [Solirubrobacteraceae bacterium]